MSDQEGIIESLTRRVEQLEQNDAAARQFDTVVKCMQGLSIRLSRIEDLGAAGILERGMEKSGMRERNPPKVNDPFPVVGSVMFNAYGDLVYTPKATRHIHPFDLPRYSAKQQHFDYMTAIDPEASPSGIPFEVALLYLKAGRKLRRVADKYQDVFEIRDGRIVGSHRHSVVSCEDAMAQDWYVIPEESKP